MAIQLCTFGLNTTACRVEAQWGDLYSTRRDVTSSATWSSNAPRVVQTVGPGALMTVGEGDAIVTATYLGTSTNGYFRVYAGEPPWQYWPTSESYLNVVDDKGRGVEGATVVVTSVHNAGQQAVTNQRGTATFHAVICGPMTVQASKDGYSDWTGSWFMCRDNVPTATIIPLTAPGF